jgi:homoserine O-succinyltransferase/O-acetyltransferase
MSGFAISPTTIMARSRRPLVSADRSDDVLTIGLINNMPDAALRATERQFCALLTDASDGLVVRLKLFAPPGIPRSDENAAHIAAFYNELDELELEPPDGIIVTGTEPRSAALEQEAYWPAIARIVDWAEDRKIPSVWSCLAAQAAVLRLDGIERRMLGAKLSGLFECQFKSDLHPLVRGLPDRWLVPHSRLYGIPEKALTSNGYEVLSRSSDVGADVFIKRTPAVHLFFQGHPEYGASALVGEYRRDVARFLRGERDRFPSVPRGYCGAAVGARFVAFEADARGRRNPDMLARLDALLIDLTADDGWHKTARRIYRNWLSWVSARRVVRSSAVSFSMADGASPAFTH